MATNTKTVTLARVSSKSQEDGYSLNSQQKLMDKYCADQKLRVVKKFRISETASKNEQRKVFREMLRYVKHQKIVNLVVEKTDRLTRNLRDAVVVDDWLESDEHRRLHMVKESLVIHKYSRSDEKLMWGIYVAFAKKYTDNLREEAMKGWQEKLAQGWMPAPSPYGYTTTVENGKKVHVIDEKRAFLVEHAFKMYLQAGQNISTVTAEVAKSGLLSSKGRPLVKSAVHKVLRNPFYIGKIQFDGKRYPGAHEPLLSRKLFMAVQDKLKDGYHERKKEHNPLFKGRQFLREDRLEDYLLMCLDEIDNSRAGGRLLHRLTGLLESMRQSYIGQHRESVMKAIRQQIKRLERIEDNLYEDKLAGVIGGQKYTDKVAELHDELTILRARLIKLESVDDNRPAADKSTSIRGLYMGESKIGKRTIIHELFAMCLENGHVRFDLKTQ
ncbi:recombinase family protein [Candidatus Saccharibacteria bacterium]|nr:recombinase family protein [Candidatus Saccharibacteria bacterium]